MLKNILIFLLALVPSAGFCAWNVQVSGTTVNLHSITASHSTINHAWACGNNGVILYTSNGGTNWIQHNSGTTKNLYCITYMEAAGGPVICVGEDGLILRTTQSTNGTWENIPSPTTKTLWSMSDFGGFAVGDSGVILKTTNFGLNWTMIASPVTERLNHVTGVFTAMACGDNGTVIRSNAQGLNWTSVPTGFSNDLYGIPMFNSNPAVISGDGGMIFASSNLGNNWFTMPSGTTRRLTSCQYSTNNTQKLYMVGFNGLIIKSTNNGANFGYQLSNTAVNLNSTFFYLDDMNGFACGDNGTILRTTDGGGTIFPTEIKNISSKVTGEYLLQQNYPNPFNPSTSIEFSIPKNANSELSIVNLKIYNALGKEVAVLINENLPAGAYSIQWDAKNFSSGTYYYKLSAGEFTETKKMLLIK